MICLLVVTDGRVDYLRESVASALANLEGPVTRRVMYDDTGDEDYRAKLAVEYPTFEHINAGERAGFGGAIRASWEHLRHIDEPFIWHHEQDFTYNQPVPLADMAYVLDDNPQLVQLALRRQPWNDTEKAAGGVVECNPDAYTERTDDDGHAWLEHRLFWTTNPSLYRQDITYKHPWPRGLKSEGVFTHNLLRSPKVRFGYWGGFDSGKAVTHIGHQRVGVGY